MGITVFGNGDLARSADPEWYRDGASRRTEQYVRGPIGYVIPKTEICTVPGR